MPARSSSGSSPTKTLDFSSPKGKAGAVAEGGDAEESESLLGPGTAASMYSHTKVKKRAQKTKQQRTWQVIFALSLVGDAGVGWVQSSQLSQVSQVSQVSQSSQSSQLSQLSQLSQVLSRQPEVRTEACAALKCVRVDWCSVLVYQSTHNWAASWSGSAGYEHDNADLRDLAIIRSLCMLLLTILTLKVSCNMRGQLVSDM
eukprot:SAG31_NODE_764_length_12262_cov_26.578887_4_plen_201_part_00